MPAMKALIFTLALGASVPFASAAESDPLEPINRAVFGFNELVDRWALRPVAIAYEKLVPSLVQQGVTNFFGNLDEVNTAVNAALQGKPEESANAIGRFVFNTTIGLGGVIDVMSSFGADATDEDFGQTLGAWGVQEGPYLVLPFIGPSTVRDVSSRLTVDAAGSPLNYLEPASHQLPLTGLDLVDTRSRLLGFDRLIRGDRYVSVRNAWLQKRRFEVTDGADSASDDFLGDF